MRRAAIDWDLVRSRLRSSEHALEEALTASPARIDAAFRERTLRLAKRAAEQTKRTVPAYLVFRLGQERYAIEIREVAEAILPERCTPVPGSPASFAGVINLRGELVAVLDLARVLELPERGERGNREGEPGFVLLLRRHGQRIGLKVDRIDGLREIAPEEISVASQGRYATGLSAGTILLSLDAVLAGVFTKERV